MEKNLEVNSETRVVRIKRFYMDSEGCYTYHFKRNAIVRGGTSSHVLFDEDKNEYVQRKPGILSYFKDFGLSALVGIVGGGMLPIRPFDTGKIIEEIN